MSTNTIVKIFLVCLFFVGPISDLIAWAIGPEIWASPILAVAATFVLAKWSDLLE